MLKLSLASFFLFVLTFSVSASEYISCHNCATIEPPTCKNLLRLKNLLHPFLRIGPQGNSADIAIDFCVGFGPKDEFMSVGMVKERFSCAKIDFEVNFKNGTKQTGTWRTIIETGRCPQIEKGFGSVINLYAGFGSNGTIDCYECNQNYCNLANTTQGSLFTLLVVSVFVNFLKF